MDLNVQQYLHLVRARIFLISGVLVISVVLAIIVTVLQSDSYRSTTTLNFDLTAGDPVSASQSAVSRAPSYITTQVGIITSLNVAQRVADSLSDEDRARLEYSFAAEYSPIDELLNLPISFVFGAIDWTMSMLDGGVVEGEIITPEKLPEKSEPQLISDGSGFEEPGVTKIAKFSWLAKGIKSRLEVEPIFATRIVSVSYSSTDPYIAALIANRVAEEYINTSIEMIVDPARRSTEWLDQRIKTLKDTLDDKRSALIEFQQSKGIVASDEKLDLENSKLNQLSNQLVVSQQEARIAKTAQAQIEEVISKGGSLLSLEQFYSHSVIQGINNDIRKLETQKTEMSGKFGENHPKFKQVTTELSSLKSKRSREVSAVAAGIKNAEKLSTSKLDALQKAVSKQKQLVLDLKNQHADIAVLVSDVESAEQAYNKALTDFNNSERISLLDQTIVNVVDPAVLPGSPYSPNMLKNVVVALTLGFAMALGLVLLAELISRKVRSTADIQELDIPLLGSLQKA